MDPLKKQTLSYYERQMMMEKKRLQVTTPNKDSNEEDTLIDNIDFEPAPAKKSKPDTLPITTNGNEGSSSHSAITLDKVMREIGVVLGYVRKISEEQKKQSNAIRKLKEDVAKMKDKLLNTTVMEKELPIQSKEQLLEIEEKMLSDHVFALQMRDIFKKYSADRNMQRLVSRPLLTKFSLKGRGELTAFKESPVMSLIVSVFTELANGMTSSQVESEMDEEIHRLRKSDATIRNTKLKREKLKAMEDIQLLVTESGEKQEEESSDSIKYEEIVIGEEFFTD